MACGLLSHFATNPTNVVFKPKDPQVPLTNDQLAAIFRSYDADNDGQLSVDELKAAFEYLGSHFCYYRSIMARYKADKDKDGKINLTNDELSELVQYAHSCGYKVKICTPVYVSPRTK